MREAAREYKSELETHPAERERERERESEII
jgi:hypothetical protein